jgi:hypothetical protein
VTAPASDRAAPPPSEPPAALPAPPHDGRTLASFTLLGGYAGKADAGPTYEYLPDGGFIIHDDETVGGSALLEDGSCDTSVRGCRTAPRSAS